MVIDVVPQDEDIVDVCVGVEVKIHKHFSIKHQVLHEGHCRSDSGLSVLVAVQVLSVKVVADRVESVVASVDSVRIKHRDNQEYEIIQQQFDSQILRRVAEQVTNEAV